MSKIIARYQKEAKKLVDAAKKLTKRIDKINPDVKDFKTIGNARIAITMNNALSFSSMEKKREARLLLFYTVYRNEYNKVAESVDAEVTALNRELYTISKAIYEIRQKALTNYVKRLSLSEIKTFVTKKIGTEKNLPIIKESLIDYVKNYVRFESEIALHIQMFERKPYITSCGWNPPKYLMKVNIDKILEIEGLDVNNRYVNHLRTPIPSSMVRHDIGFFY